MWMTWVSCNALASGVWPCPPYTGRWTRSANPESRSVTTGKPIYGKLQHNPIIFDCLEAQLTSSALSCTPSYPTESEKVFWGIFWRSCGPPTRSVRPTVRSGKPTDRSVGLLVGRSHLSGMTVSLVGGDPGVPMSHKLPSDV
jgi:hypothetical protein